MSRPNNIRVQVTIENGTYYHLSHPHGSVSGNVREDLVLTDAALFAVFPHKGDRDDYFVSESSRASGYNTRGVFLEHYVFVLTHR